jgi:hypothetical protein
MSVQFIHRGGKAVADLILVRCMSVDTAIKNARATLACPPVEQGEDPRWQAIIDVGEYLQGEPERIWSFIVELHDTQDGDLRSALATCLLEHLIEAELLAARSVEFRRMLEMCW